MKLDHLEDILKARKAKGLDNWAKFDKVRDALAGKQASHISFTTSYPGQEGSKKYLGSTSGNLHFLLGYVNPGFYLAPYHWRLVDPNLTDEEISKKQHPANPRYWAEAELGIIEEGDFDGGTPHPSTRKQKTSRAKQASRKSDAKTTTSGYGSYVAIPSESMVYSLTNGQVYDWSIVRESYFAATNQEIAQEMDAYSDEGDDDSAEKSLSTLESLRKSFEPFSPHVYPLVKSVFPVPGSIVALDDQGYARITPTSIEFFDTQGTPDTVEVFEHEYESFDLTKGGNIHPSIIVNFAVEYLGLNKEDLSMFVHTEDDASLPLFYKGLPSTGYEDLPEQYDREVVFDNGHYRVIPVQKVSSKDSQ